MSSQIPTVSEQAGSGMRGQLVGMCMEDCKAHQLRRAPCLPWQLLPEGNAQWGHSFLLLNVETSQLDLYVQPADFEMLAMDSNCYKLYARNCSWDPWSVIHSLPIFLIRLYKLSQDPLLAVASILALSFRAHWTNFSFGNSSAVFNFLRIV